MCWQDGNTALRCAVTKHGANLEHQICVKEHEEEESTKLVNEQISGVVKLLLAAKADVGGCDGGSLVLHTAASAGDFQMVSVLIDAKVDVDALDEVSCSELSSE